MTNDYASEPDTVRRADVYRAVWRWHFYAGLLVLPFMILLAVTGGLYLFHNEIENTWYRDLRYVQPAGTPALAPSALTDAALRAHPGTLAKYVPPAAPDAAAQAVIKPAGGDSLSVYVNPYSGQVLGALPERGTLMWTIRRLHSLDYFGPIANGAIEIAAGWSILLVLTGIYLWWPRGRKQGVVSVRGTPRKRVFWRDIHAVTGAAVGLFILFLAFTGMPWSIVWGGKVNQWANGNNFGYPAGVRVAVPMSDEHLAHMGHTTWSLEQARMPESSPVHGMGKPIGLDTAVARFDSLGMAPGYAINVPHGASGVYTASAYPDDLSRQRVVHLDQYSGKPLLDMSYADYGPLGKTLEWGINVHMGQEFGLANQLILLAACLGIVLLSVAGGLMWWKRRPEGGLGIPPMPAARGALRGVLALMIVGGIIFPLVGASLLVMLVLDLLVQRRARVDTQPYRV
ncbi:PepSY domain-containing protein [Bordetella sp. BOR01]|uniref:PepSY-associated TM helix domain-containing protein n=1 Tax=Bordetella sp. BOR01 TaxID=2854779 RepID=UPI001C495687|nr:PepSY domain-containing protein [Bordetella sp. BOR01]MBV7486808.1 PepSY domain-containing protein [Bordetella sp. BOR01]